MSAKIPLTHRDYASSITVISRDEGKHKEEVLDWKLLAELKETLVILMGVANLEKNVEKLLKYGKGKDTPIAIIESGTTKQQRTIIGRYNKDCKGVNEILRNQIIIFDKIAS